MLDQLYYAFENTAQFMLVNESKPFALLAVLLAAAVWKLNRERTYRILGAIPAFVALATGVFTPLYSGWFPHTPLLFENEVSNTNFINIQPYLGTAVAVWLTCNVVINFYLVYSNGWKTWLCSAVFLVGVVSNIAIIYLHPERALTLRPALIMFVCFGVICLFLLQLLFEILSKKQKRVLLSVVALVILYVGFKFVVFGMRHLGMF